MPATTSALQAGPAALISGCDSAVTSSTTPVDAQQQRQREQGSEDVPPASRAIISDRARHRKHHPGAPVGSPDADVAPGEARYAPQ
jgi:hypothetical protein